MKVTSNIHYQQSFYGRYIESVGPGVSVRLLDCARGAASTLNYAASLLPKNIDIHTIGNRDGITLAIKNRLNGKVLGKRLFDAPLIREELYTRGGGYLQRAEVPLDVALISETRRMLARRYPKAETKLSHMV